MTPNSRKYATLVLLACGLCRPCFASAEDLQGAKAVLQHAEPSAAQSDAAVKVKVPINHWPEVRAALQDYQRRVGGLAPDAAAREWLALADRCSQTRANPGDYVPSVREVAFQELLSALPPPASWPALETLVKARPMTDRRNRALRLLVDTLNNHETAQLADAGALLKPVHGGGAGANDDMISVADALLATVTTPQRLEEALKLRLVLIPAPQTSLSIDVPDLVTLLGREKAKRYLEQALMLPRTTISVDAGEETKRLAQQIALANVAKLPMAQWSLVNTVDAAPLYAALAKRFPAKKLPENAYDPDAYIRRNALPYYFLGLIVEGRTAAATKVVDGETGLGEEYVLENALTYLRRTDRMETLFNFFSHYLSTRPGSPLWRQYLQIAAQLNKSGEVLTLTRAAAAAPQSSPRLRAAAQLNLANALLAADHVDEGAAALRRAIAAEGANINSEDAAHLARLGHVVGRPEWVSEGLSASEASYQAHPDANWSGYGALLVDEKRYSEAERVYDAALSTTTHASNYLSPESYYNSNSDPATPILAALVSLYQKAGRSQDIVDLLDRGAYWGVPDLAKIPQEVDRPVILYQTAAALAAVGRSEEAIKIVHANLQWSGRGYDPNYALLTTLEGKKAIPFLDDLFAHDQFEERPLIWKAELLRRAGRLEEAEAAARAAIAVDPSDGDEPHGDRMRAYSVLADIRAARGDAEQAKSLRGAVAAIRLAEQGDDQLEAGLLARATATYEEASRQFADAYCIQSRLAVRLSAAGDNAAAAEHYRRAFELMPSSFGRMESHCFGCEGAFQGKQAQSIAERVFKEALVKSPDKPQLHYLLGYLREEQQRPSEAAPQFLAAAKLDPDYLNAWLHLLSADAATGLPASPLRDQAVFHLLRLDPQGRHLYWRDGAEPSGIRDLAEYWKAVAAAQSQQLAPVDTLYPLPAAAAFLEQRSSSRDAYYKQQNQPAPDYSGMVQQGDDTPHMDSPGTALAAHHTVSAIGQLLDNIPISPVLSAAAPE